jgi:ankyrin repeat protein
MSGVSRDQNSLFNMASVKGNFEVEDFEEEFELYVEKGVDLVLSNGMNVFHAGAIFNNPKYVQAAMSKVPCSCDASDSDGRTPLSYACEKGHTEIVNILLSNGADVNKNDNEEIYPHSYAEKNSHEEIARLIVERDR